MREIEVTSPFAALARCLRSRGAVHDALEGADDIHSAASRLCDWGAAQWYGGQFEFRSPWSVGALELFAGVLDLCRLQVLETTLPGAPICMIAVLADTAMCSTKGGDAGTGEDLELVAGGQGLSRSEALMSAIGELAERLSLWSMGPDDPRVFGRKNSGQDMPLAPFIGLSDRQAADLRQRYPALVADADGDGINWNALSRRRVATTSWLTQGAQGRRVSNLPAFGVLMGEGKGLGLGGLNLVSTSGTAVWSDREEAARRALLEVVERDAIGQFWYNRLGITRIDEAIWRDLIHRNCFEYVTERHRKTDFYAVDTEFSTHVVAAISREPNGLGACFGSAARRSVPQAIMSALGELLQSERSLALSVQAHMAGGGNRVLPAAVQYASAVNIDEDLKLSAAAAADAVKLERDYSAEALLESCLQRGIRLHLFDATRPDLDVPCAKVLSQDLCSWLPRFGKRRLFEGVLARGWRDTPLCEDDFELRPFPF
ncbi:YcaO-like family protein [Roseibium sp.]|uniref:YcaO-like family protein n=1 Tax=Roseibium sp. TaxID=1936156 RepID=UPI003A96C965